MRVIGGVVCLALAALGCGDNNKPEGGQPASRSPGAPASVGGSQVAHSKSFMLVTNVASGHAPIAKSASFVHKSGVGGE
jgi:hypothetical protein